MIYAIGLDTDKTFRHFLRESSKNCSEIVPINLRAVVKNGSWRFSIPDDGSSFITVGNEHIELDADASYYSRIIDLSYIQSNLDKAARWRNLVDGFSSWLEHIPGIVVNRPGGHSHNFAKPLHEYFLISKGFQVPESLTTSNREHLIDFVKRGRAIIKSVSAQRVNTRLIDIRGLRTFNKERGPIHVQRFIEGHDIRAHVVGSKVHSEIIRSQAVDYRNTTLERSYSSYQLPKALERRLIDIGSLLGLLFVGWDFKLDRDGQYWCLEVNPMPGYDSYDKRLGGSISESLIFLLKNKVS